MKKNILSFLTLFYLICGSFAEENVYDLLLKKLSNTNKTFFLEQVENKIKNRNILNEKMKWLPKLSLENKATVMGFMQEKNQNAFEVNSNLVLRQKLLLGSSLKLFANNNLRMLKSDELKFNHNFLAGASINLPLYVMSPKLFISAASSDFYSQKNVTKMLFIKNKIVTATEVSNAVNYLGEYFLQNEKIILIEKKLLLLKKLTEVNNIFLQEGKLSTLDFNEKLLAYEKENAILLNAKFNLKALKLKILNTGLTLDDLPEIFLTWIEDWEKLLSNVKIENISALDLQKLQLDAEWNQSVKKFMTATPNLFVSCSFQNVDPEFASYNKSFFSSVEETFKKNAEFKWTVNLGLNLSFDPFTEKAQLDQNFADKKMIYLTQQKMLNEKYEEQIMMAKNTLYNLQEIIKHKNETLKINTKRFEQIEIMYNAGKLSANDFQLQQIYLDNARLEFLKARLNLICYLLAFYKN
ncbi:MAG: TolC family protein [Treponemataceae bacterium]